MLVEHLSFAALYGLLVFPVLLLVAAASDVLSLKIPNWVALALLAGFAGALLFAGLPLTAIALHGAVGLGAFLAGFALFAARVFGGGDGKLFAVAALWLGWPAVLPFLIWASLAGGVLALALLTLRRMPLPATLLAHGFIARLYDRKVGIPYAVAFAAGGLMAYPQSPLFPALTGG